MFSSKKHLAGLVACALALSPAAGFAQSAATKPAPKPAATAPAPAPAAPPTAPAPQGGQPQGPVKVDLLPFGDWIKTCGTDQVNKKEICFVTHEFGTAQDQNPLMAMAIYEIKGDKEHIIRLLLPLGFMIKPGFRFSVDKGADLTGAFDFCLPNGCFTESTMDGASFGYQPAPALSQSSTALNDVTETADVALASTPEPGTLSMVVLGGLLVVLGVGFKRKD